MNLEDAIKKEVLKIREKTRVIGKTHDEVQVQLIDLRIALALINIYTSVGGRFKENE